MWSRLSNAKASIEYCSQWPWRERTATLAKVFVSCVWLLAPPYFVLSAPRPTAAQSSLAAESIPAEHTPQEISARILQRSILQSVWGPPAYCVVRQSMSMFSMQLHGVGDYVRGGEGSGRLKYNLRMPAGDQLNTLLQVSDGQRLLSIESIGDVSRRTEVDLGKIRPRLMLTSDSLRDPVVAMYLAIGGQAELLRKIYQQYEWVSVRDGKLGDVEVWWLSGIFPSQPVPIRSVAAIDNMLFAENNSGLLPTHIEIAIGKADARLPYWLYQVAQSRVSSELSPLALSTELRIVTEWATPTLLAQEQLPPSIFELPSSSEQLFDETDKYLPPLPAMADNSVPDIVR